MKIAFHLFSRLTEKKILIPRFLYQIFPRLGDINLKRNGSVLLYSKISGLDLDFIFGGSSMSIR